MSVPVRVERSGPAIRAVLAEVSPLEAVRFEREYSEALSRATRSLDLSEADALLTRWWGVAALRANPLTDQEQQQLHRLQTGEDVGWDSPTARHAADQATAS